MSKRRWQFGIKVLTLLGVVAALLWVGGSMGGPLLASARDSGNHVVHGQIGHKTTSESADQPAEEATEASGDSLESGYDSWVTPDNNATTLDVPFPAGFFCNGLSSAVTKTIAFRGVPFTTDPVEEIGAADTLIERMDTANFVNGVATTRIRIVGLSLASRVSFSVTCPNGTTEDWSAKLRLDRTQPAPIGSMTIRQNAANSGGTFDSDFDVPAAITFTGPGGATAGPLTHTAHMSGRNGPWARIVASKVWLCRVSYWIDVDGDGIGDIFIEYWRCPGRGGFHPGWAPHPTNPTVPGTPVKWYHSGAHPEIYPVCLPSCIITGGGTGSGTGTGTAANPILAPATGVVGN